MGCCSSTDYISNTTNIEYRNIQQTYNNNKNFLHNLSTNNSKYILVKHSYTIGKVINVYDGDTVTIAFILNNNKLQIKCRLNRIDAPEIKCLLTQPNRDLEKEAATHVKLFLHKLLFNRIVYFKYLQNDKFGRALIELYTLDNLNVSDYLIKKGIVKEYNGNKKEKFTDTELKLIINTC